MVMSMTRSLSEKASARSDRGRAKAPTALVVFSHRGHKQRLDEYQCNVADFAPMRPFNFGEIADRRQLHAS
jgi:hypothetical protein